jgi:kinesin family protein 23
MQPKFGRKKSVSRVELNDAKKSSKYALTHQQTDSNGEIVTNLIKGDLLRSPSGGANCIFTDIETLNVREQPQASKTSRKRTSVEETIEEAVIQERVRRTNMNLVLSFWKNYI